MVDEVLTGAQQENLLALLAHDDDHGRLVANMVETQLFEGEYRIIAERFVKYWNDYDTAPKQHAPDLFADILEDKGNRRRGTYQQTLVQCAQLAQSGVNAQYVLNQLREFTRLQRLKEAIIRAGDLLSRPQPTTIMQTEDLLSEILRARSHNFDPGVRLSDVDHLLARLDRPPVEFSTGIAALDRGRITPQRKELITFIAPSGYGKSWWLCNLCKHAVLQRKRVFYATLEIGDAEVMQRMYQALFSVPQRMAEDAAALIVNRLARDNDGRGFKGLRSIEIEPEFSFESASLRDELMTRLELFGDRILQHMVIKQFPTRGLTVNGLRGYLDGLEQVERFIPDLMVIDYPGIMKTDEKNHRISLGRVFEDIRGLLVERNMAGAVVHQGTRNSFTARRVSGAKHASEDISIYQTSDKVVTMSATEAERRRGLARLFADKARNDRDGWGVLITQAYAIGQFVLDHMHLPNSYYDFLERIGAREDNQNSEDAEDDD